MILTRQNMNWGHFATRKRYIKDETGAVVGARYDRILIGWRPAGRPWLEKRYSGDDPVMIFILGDKNVVFTHRKGDDKVYVNQHAGSQALEYAAFYSEQAGAEQVFVDDLPTGEKTRQSGQVNSLEDAIAKACGMNIDDLGI